MENTRQKIADPNYADVRITIHHSRREKEFAFGTGKINGVEREIFVGSKGHATKDGEGRWAKTGTPTTPLEGDMLDAKVCLKVDQGKKPYAAFWQRVRHARDDYDYFEGNDYTSDDLNDVDETPCEWCGCWPCRCEREY